MNRRALFLTAALIGIIVVIVVFVFSQSNQGFAVLTPLPPQGSQIAFLVHDEPETYFNLYILNFDSSNTDSSNTNSGEITQITEGNAVRRAEWQPDGEHMTVVVQEAGQSTTTYHLNVSTGMLGEPVEEQAQAEANTTPQTSSDGQRVFSVEDTNDQWGGVVRQTLTVTSNDDTGGTFTDDIDLFTRVQWSPEGDSVIYQRSGFVCSITLPDGTQDCPIEGHTPVWSNDGVWLAYGTSGTWEPSAASGQICVSQWTEQRRCFGAFSGIVSMVGWRPNPDTAP